MEKPIEMEIIICEFVIKLSGKIPSKGPASSIIIAPPSWQVLNGRAARWQYFTHGCLFPQRVIITFTEMFLA